MNGFVEVPNRNRRFAYTFEDQILTVYSANSLPLTSATDLGITSSNKFLVATNTEKSTLVVFFVDHFPFDDGDAIIWTSTTLKVYYYIDGIHEDRRFSFDRLCFAFDELNHFFNINAGMKRHITENRTQTIETLPYEETQKEFSFVCNEKSIGGEIGIVQVLRWNSTIPLELHNQLAFTFESTVNIDFLLNLYAVEKRLFCLLCYRRNIRIDKVELYGYSENNLRCTIGIFHSLYSDCSYTEDRKTLEKTVKFHCLESKLSELVQAIADEKVYTEHIPETKQDGSRITVARTILITAAFEWTFTQTYGSPPLSAYRQEVKADILEKLDVLPEEKSYNSKKKSEVKLYHKIVSNVDRNLSEKIQYALKDCANILEPFMRRLYAINGMEVAPFAQIADDLQYQRNAYAHGQIDRELKENIVLDVIILEWLNYCMLFKCIGYDEIDIFNAINQIFTRGFIDKTKEVNPE